METNKIVAYYRVSTLRQGKTGLGLGAQKIQLQQYAEDNNAKILQEFTDIESGKKRNREELIKAIAFAKYNDAVLVIAKLDRLARDVEFIFQLKNSQVNFKALDLPDMNTLTIGIYATIAQHEREIISKRTKDALHAKKMQGFKLGKPENFKNVCRLKGALRNKIKARENQKNKDLFMTIKMYRDQFISYNQIAKILNENGTTTVTGKKFYAMTVKRIYNMFA